MLINVLVVFAIPAAVEDEKNDSELFMRKEPAHGLPSVASSTMFRSSPCPENQKRNSDGLCRCPDVRFGVRCRDTCFYGRKSRDDKKCECIQGYTGWECEQRDRDVNLDRGTHISKDGSLDSGGWHGYHRILTPLLLLPVVVLLSFWLRKRRMERNQRRLRELLDMAITAERLRIMGTSPSQVLRIVVYLDPEQQQVRTLNEEDLHRLPEQTYACLLAASPNRQIGSTGLATAVVPHPSAGIPCAICVEDFTPEVIVKELPCSHVFHARCIDTWLAEHDVTCPMCRDDVLKALDSAANQSSTSPTSKVPPLSSSPNEATAIISGSTNSVSSSSDPECSNGTVNSVVHGSRTGSHETVSTTASTSCIV